MLEVSLLSFPSWVRSVFVMQRVAREFQEGVWARGASYPLTLASSLSLTSPPAPLVDEAQSVGGISAVMRCSPWILVDGWAGSGHLARRSLTVSLREWIVAKMMGLQIMPSAFSVPD